MNIKELKLNEYEYIINLFNNNEFANYDVATLDPIDICEYLSELKFAPPLFTKNDYFKLYENIFMDCYCETQYDTCLSTRDFSPSDNLIDNFKICFDTIIDVWPKFNANDRETIITRATSIFTTIKEKYPLLCEKTLPYITYIIADNYSLFLDFFKANNSSRYIRTKVHNNQKNNVISFFEDCIVPHYYEYIYSLLNCKYKQSATNSIREGKRLKDRASTQAVNVQKNHFIDYRSDFFAAAPQDSYAVLSKVKTKIQDLFTHELQSKSQLRYGNALDKIPIAENYLAFINMIKKLPNELSTNYDFAMTLYAFNKTTGLLSFHSICNNKEQLYATCFFLIPIFDCLISIAELCHIRSDVFRNDISRPKNFKICPNDFYISGNIDHLIKDIANCYDHINEENVLKDWLSIIDSKEKEQYHSQVIKRYLNLFDELYSNYNINIDSLSDILSILTLQIVESSK